MKYYINRPKRFFRIALSHSSLEIYFDTNFSLMQHHNYALFDIDNMMPWEREIYVDMLIEHIKEENKKHRRTKQEITTNGSINRLTW